MFFMPLFLLILLGIVCLPLTFFIKVPGKRSKQSGPTLLGENQVNHRRQAKAYLQYTIGLAAELGLMFIFIIATATREYFPTVGGDIWRVLLFGFNLAGIIYLFIFTARSLKQAQLGGLGTAFEIFQYLITGIGLLIFIINFIFTLLILIGLISR